MIIELYDGIHLLDSTSSNFYHFLFLVVILVIFGLCNFCTCWFVPLSWGDRSWVFSIFHESLFWHLIFIIFMTMPVKVIDYSDIDITLLLNCTC